MLAACVLPLCRAFRVCAGGKGEIVCEKGRKAERGGDRREGRREGEGERGTEARGPSEEGGEGGEVEQTGGRVVALGSNRRFWSVERLRNARPQPPLAAAACRGEGERGRKRGKREGLRPALFPLGLWSLSSPPRRFVPCPAPARAPYLGASSPRGAFARASGGRKKARALSHLLSKERGFGLLLLLLWGVFFALAFLDDPRARVSAHSGCLFVKGARVLLQMRVCCLCRG